jgi:hypothetical protein
VLLRLIYLSATNIFALLRLLPVSDGVPPGNSISWFELGFLLRERWRSWEHLGVLLSLAYRLVRCMFGLLAVLVRSDPAAPAARRHRHSTGATRPDLCP